MSRPQLILVLASVMLGMVPAAFLREIPLRTSNAPGTPADVAAGEREEAAR
jgi:hypothetical protein